MVGSPVTAREEVLERIRSALAAAPAPSEEVPRDYRTTGQHPPGHPALLDLLADRLTDYRARVWRTTAEDLPATIAAALPAGARIVIPPGLTESWVRGATRDDGLDADTLDTFDGVVTAAAVAIAETGTIVLDAGPDQGRRAITLVPDLHVCVVRAEQVVAGVPEALRRLDPTRPQTWISGPSATSDIELDRVEGVHGPRTLEVVLVEPTV
jgi:L-lactate dehydrogenase complex protein LldG